MVPRVCGSTLTRFNSYFQHPPLYTLLGSTAANRVREQGEGTELKFHDLLGVQYSLILWLAPSCCKGL